MSCKPKTPAEDGSLHLLASFGSELKIFEWVNGSWNTPGTGWGTKPSAMATLGWRYVGPHKPIERSTATENVG